MIALSTGSAGSNGGSDGNRSNSSCTAASSPNALSVKAFVLPIVVPVRGVP